MNWMKQWEEQREQQFEETKRIWDQAKKAEHAKRYNTSNSSTTNNRGRNQRMRDQHPTNGNTNQTTNTNRSEK